MSQNGEMTPNSERQAAIFVAKYVIYEMLSLGSIKTDRVIGEIANWMPFMERIIQLSSQRLPLPFLVLIP